MPDAKSFVAAIAAAPADDLPRLVFADWLDEHGEPDRAEFIRTQIQWHHADAEKRKQLDRRSADLFREHWPLWFGSFVLALDPNADLRRDFRRQSRNGAETLQYWGSARHPGSPVRTVQVERGFVKEVTLDLSAWGERASIADAFQLEPPTTLTCHDGLHSPVWSRFTDPALRRVSVLHIRQMWAWDLSAPESTALLEDPHLAGVREFSLDPDNPADNAPVMLPLAWLERFVRSSLAYRLTRLKLWRLPTGGVVPLCRPGRLRLEDLGVGMSVFTPNDVQRLGASELSQTVTKLELSCNVSDAVAAALARDNWPKLTHLNLFHNHLTAAVLPALAAAAFTPRLTQLNLSLNPLFDGTDLRGLERLAEALDPERLERLDLTDTGLTDVPDFLAERFGNRVEV
jgi:uncharacterized protein (TIGR02996 family)